MTTATNDPDALGDAGAAAGADETAPPQRTWRAT